MPEVQRQIQNTMRGRQLPPEILPNFVPQMVDQMITERALAYEAERLGFEVTDAQVADAIRQTGARPCSRTASSSARTCTPACWRSRTCQIDEFEADVKRQLLATRMRDIALEGTIVTPLEIEQEYRKKNEKIKIEYVKIAVRQVQGRSPAHAAGDAGLLQRQHRRPTHRRRSGTWLC